MHNYKTDTVRTYRNSMTLNFKDSGENFTLNVPHYKSGFQSSNSTTFTATSFNHKTSASLLQVFCKTSASLFTMT